MGKFAVAAVFAALLSGQTFKGRPSIELSNDRLHVTLLQDGGSIASIVRLHDPERLNPLWDPTNVRNAGVGSFLCVDGFGPTSKEEAAAGLPGHGEAIRTRFETLQNQNVAEGVSSITLTATLPIVQERVIRNYQLKRGENVMYVRTRLESLLGFDRPISWAEHATIGSPYLERGVTAVDIPAVRSETRPYPQPANHRLVSAKEFTWPDAPLVAGGTVDLRTAPVQSDSGDHTTSLMDRSRTYAYATAVNPKRRLVVGWIWHPSDFPWVQNWENYPASGMLARGMEFSTQPYDIPRREAVALNGMFGAPTFRWLPAKSAIETTFVIFYTEIPEGFNRVQNVSVENGTIILTGPGNMKVEVPAALPF